MCSASVDVPNDVIILGLAGQSLCTGALSSDHSLYVYAAMLFHPIFSSKCYVNLAFISGRDVIVSCGLHVDSHIVQPPLKWSCSLRSRDQ